MLTKIKRPAYAVRFILIIWLQMPSVFVLPQAAGIKILNLELKTIKQNGFIS